MIVNHKNFNQDEGDSFLNSVIEGTPAAPSGSGGTAPVVSTDKEKTVVTNKDTANESSGNNDESTNESDIPKDDNLPLIETIINRVGFVVTEEDGTPRKYEDTEDGLAQYFLDIEPLRRKAVYDEIKDQKPEVSKFVDHILSGGTEDSYFKKYVENDWFKVSINEDTPEVTKRDIVIKGYVEKGYDKEEAEIIVDAKIKSSDLDELANSVIEERQKNQKAKENEERARAREQEQAQRERDLKTLDTVKTLVNNGVLSSNIGKAKIIIPEAERSSFLKYITQPVNNYRESQSVVDAKKINLDTQLLMDYFMFKGFDLNLLITRAASAQKAETLRERIERQKQGSAGTTRTVGATNNGVPLNLDDWNI